TQISVPVEEGGQKIFRFKKWLVLIIGMVAWGYISFSITLPREPLSYTPNQVEVNDIFFVIDVSRSMLANDFKPDRLTVAKEKIREFVKLRPKDRIGIIMFSEKAFTLLPLSTDLELIQKIIDDIKVGFLGSGTNIGDALALAVARGAQSPTENKVIVLLTDGVSNVGVMTPSQAAVKAKDQDIKVYTIGIGGARDAKIPLGRGLLGGKRFQNIPGGSIDMQTLDEIANLTGGKSYYARDEKALTDVLDEIERLERTEINLSSKIIYKEHYFKYLLIGVLLLVLCELLSMYLLRLVI
ncbi:MAG: VWA domain-containing protein, partial [Bacteriovoracaceae bacterium]